MINFKEITNANIWKVCTLEPFEEQKDFVAENIQSLAEAYATRNEGGNALPLAVYNDETLVGFIMIGKGTVGNEKESELIKKNYSLWRLMIDKKYQGKGFGRQTLDAAMALIRTYPFGKADKVWLSYDRTGAADPAYRNGRCIYCLCTGHQVPHGLYKEA